MISIWTFACALSALIGAGLFALWMRGRRVFLLPSGALLGLTFVLFLLPQIFYRERIAELTDFGDVAFLYTAVFAMGNMLLVAASLVLRRPGGPAVPPSFGDELAVLRSTFVAAFAILVLILTLYLSYVPWQHSGLYAVLFDAENATLAREDSLKLLGVPWLQYAYLIGFSMLSPLTVVCAIELHFVCRRLSGASMLVVGAVVGVYLLITGARIGIANMVLVVFLWIAVRRNLRVKLGQLTVFAAMFLSTPIVLSIAREGVSDPNIYLYLDAVAQRIFLLPTAITGWYVEYVHDFGLVDVLINSGNIANDVALQYIARHESIGATSVTTPTAYFIQNYVYFGWFGLLPSWGALVLLDVPARLAQRLPTLLRRPCLAVLLYYGIVLMQSGFGTSMLTHGYLILSLFILFLHTYFQHQKKQLRHV